MAYTFRKAARTLRNTKKSSSRSKYAPGSGKYYRGGGKTYRGGGGSGFKPNKKSTRKYDSSGFTDRKSMWSDRSWGRKKKKKKFSPKFTKMNALPSVPGGV